MACIPKGTPGFDFDSRISNARFNYVPNWICYCESADDVIEALRKARKEGLPVRVRAGGHHHEGMCSGDNVLIVDVSRMNKIVVDENAKTVTVEPGAKLKDIYAAVLGKGYLFPGGACGDVHVGGLVQGGGWGLFTRELGLTCDSLYSFRMVTWFDNAGKDDFKVTPVNNPQADLYWAVRGGGGGNFGVATEFVFGISSFKDRPAKQVTQFSATWDDRDVMGEVLAGWLRKFPLYPDTKLTTFCRLIAPGTEVSEGDKPSLVLGNYIGARHELDAILEELLPRQDKVTVCYSPVAVWPPVAALNLKALAPAAYQAGPPGEGEKLSDTCSGGYFRHKVSSAYPIENNPAKLSAAATNMILKHVNGEPLSGARRYISLHSLGGNVNDDQKMRYSCFAYRDKPFLMQYQAWWTKPELDTECLAWVNNFRDAMHLDKDNKPLYTEGAFINFPDRDLVKTTVQKVLMEPYYGEVNLEKLMRIKNEVDPRGVFDFPMGIPRS